MKTIGYIRVSTDKQEEHGVSLADQEARIKAYCDMYGLFNVDIVTDTASGKNLNRDGFKALLTQIDAGQVSNVVVTKLDRMFRSTVDTLQTIQQFDKKGVAFHSITEKIDSKSAMGEFFLTLLAALAQMERRMISERTTAGLAHKKSVGEKTGGQVPYGFMSVLSDDGKKMLVREENEQRALIWMVQAKKEGTSFGEIAKSLNSTSWETRTGVPWSSTVVRRILLREGVK